MFKIFTIMFSLYFTFNPCAEAQIRDFNHQNRNTSIHCANDGSNCTAYVCVRLGFITRSGRGSNTTSFHCNEWASFKLITEKDFKRLEELKSTVVDNVDNLEKSLKEDAILNLIRDKLKNVLKKDLEALVEEEMKKK